MKIELLTVLDGARWGLNQASALCRLQGFAHLPAQTHPFDTHLYDVVAELQRSAPVPGLALSSEGEPILQAWPSALLVHHSPTGNLPAWYAAMVVGLQRLARDAVGRARVLSMEADTCLLAVPWQRESVLQASLMWALKLTFMPNSVTPELHQWLREAQLDGLSPNTLRFALAALEQEIPIRVEQGRVRLGWGSQAERLDSSFTDHSSCVAATIARKKHLTNQLLREACLPVPRLDLVSDWPSARIFARALGWPVVVKPSNQEQGTGVFPGIRDEISLKQAFEVAAQFSPGEVIVEEHVEGHDYRLLVVGYQLLMASQRIAGGVTGDGVSTVTQLVARVNQNPRRGADTRSLLMQLALDDEAQRCLSEQDLSADSVLTLNCFVRLRRTANISTGATAHDVTRCVHPDNKRLAERAARLIGLDIAGVDFLSPDISRSWREVGGAICEVNAQPGFRPHWLGDPARDINAEIVKGLFQHKSVRIPTAAITGTNGKSTTARMLHHIWMTSGKMSGVASTQGVWVGHERVSFDNLSGLPGARILFADPAVQAAVLEMPRKGLLVFGHPCDYYDVAALLNIQDDHIGVDGINSLDEMARLKSEVLMRARHAIVLNAEDARCLSLRAQMRAARHILVAREADAAALVAHLNEGGQGVFAKIHQGELWIILAEGSRHSPLMPLDEMPATRHGLLRFNEVNALFAVALAWAQGIVPNTIRSALRSFANTPGQNPGRYNFIEGFPFQVLVDFGHNPDGVIELCRVLANLPVSGKRRLLSLTIGNRHAAHLAQLTPLLSQTFDQFVLGCNADDVQKASDYAGGDPIGLMLSTYQSLLLKQGLDCSQITIERDNQTALQHLLNSAMPGDILLLLTESEDVFTQLDRHRLALAQQRDHTLTLVVESSIEAFAASEWDACAGGHPYVSHGFFQVLEKWGDLGATRGVIPQYIGLKDAAGRLLACTPAMLKWGNKREFGPEIHWLKAAEAQGIFSWPKFQVGVPLIAMQGPRLLVRAGLPVIELQTLLIEALRRYAAQSDALNVMHCTETESSTLQKQGWLISHEPGSVWRNFGYTNFDSYLATLNSKLRYTIRKERQEVALSGVLIQNLAGSEIPAGFWSAFYEGHRRVSARYGGTPWFSEDFFVALAQALPQAIRVIAAFKGNHFLAASLCLVDQNTLYIDTWSAIRPVGALTFELSCHLPRIYAIAAKLEKVDFGLAAPHKTMRGFSAEPVHNAHWFRSEALRIGSGLSIVDPEFKTAI